MDIIWYESLDSTQSYLLEAIKTGVLNPPVCVGVKRQNAGRGSRGNEWIGNEGNFFISFALNRVRLPDDLKLESTSIYMAFLMKELLERLGSKVWLKWPNDFYLGERKIGGVITNITDKTLVCGIGINLISAPKNFDKIDIEIAPQTLADYYCRLFDTLPSWKQIFSKYQIEFEHSREFFTHHNYEKIALEKAVLLNDGSLECEGQRIFSLR